MALWWMRGAWRPPSSTTRACGVALAKLLESCRQAPLIHHKAMRTCSCKASRELPPGTPHPPQGHAHLLLQSFSRAAARHPSSTTRPCALALAKLLESCRQAPLIQHKAMRTCSCKASRELPPGPPHPPQGHAHLLLQSFSRAAARPPSSTTRPCALALA